jgi:hypothetical protein
VKKERKKSRKETHKGRKEGSKEGRGKRNKEGETNITPKSTVVRLQLCIRGRG